MMNEDGTITPDRSQKKRIQNRVAQRTYRNRIKQRVEELEREVNEYRRREQQHTEGNRAGTPSANGLALSNRTGAAEDKTSPTSDKIKPPNAVRSSRLSSSKANGNSSGDDRTTDKASSNSSYVMDLDLTDGDCAVDGTSHDQTGLLQHDTAMQPQMLTQPANTRSNIPSQIAFAPFPSFSSPPLSQPYGLTPDWPWSHAHGSVYRDSINHQALSAFPSLSTDSRQGRGEQDVTSDASYQVSPEPAYMIQPKLQERSQILTPPDGTVDPPSAAADRSSDAGSSVVSSPSSTGSMADARAHGENHLASMPESSSQMRNRPLEERFEYLRQCMENLGLGSFDATMGQYYTAEFNHESIVSREQRNSRHSELPLLLSKLRKNATDWSQWEAHGYQYEIIKSAESIVGAERGDFAVSQGLYHDVLAEIEKLPPGGDGIDKASRAFHPLTKKFQDTASQLCTRHSTTAS
ncbi:hypothetical protein RJ55_04872 [Drechmeria coniospora]|nr:hypothetical protein RJ55_04872 [Drechmeria coniospora]